MMKKFLYIPLSLFIGVPVFAAECDFIRLGSCFSCDSPYAFPISDEAVCTTLCPKRVFQSVSVGNGVFLKTCTLNKCPDNFPFRSVYGSCFASEEESLSDDGSSVPENANEENLKDIFDEPCPKEFPLRRWDGSCFPCDIEQTVYLDSTCNLKEDCEILCPSRTVLYRDGGNPPSIPNCPKEIPLMDENGICHSCDINVDISFEFNGRLCQKNCPTTRHIQDGKCVRN